MNKGPLHGVRVIDLTTVVMGPFATRILGDLGADVVKVERPGGDSTRRLGPSRNAGMGPYFMNLNRNKRSIVLDLKATEDRDMLVRLVEGADVFVTNVRVKALKKLGLTYDRIGPANPRLIYASLVGYGQDGPYGQRPAYDDLMQGAVGIPSLFMRAGSKEPRYAPFNVADRVVGMAAANAIMAALFTRERTGKGHLLEVPMFETMTDFILTEHMGGLAFEPPTGPSGYTRTLVRDRAPYATKDGYVCALAYTDKHWNALFDMSDTPDRYKADPRFKDLASRTAHSAEIYPIVAEIMKTKTTAEWLSLLAAADIPVTPMHSVESLIEDAHHAATGFFSIVDHPTEGKMRSIRTPTRWSGKALPQYRPAPRLGEHSQEIREEISSEGKTPAN